MPDEELKSDAAKIAAAVEEGATVYKAAFTHGQVQSFEIPTMYFMDPEKTDPAKNGIPVTFTFRNGVMILQELDPAVLEAKLTAFEKAVKSLHGVDRNNIFQMKETDNLIAIADRGIVRGAVSSADIKSPTKDGPAKATAPSTGLRIGSDGKIVPAT